MDRGITRKPSGGITEFAADVTASKIGAPEKSTAEKSLVTRTNAVRRHLDTPPLTLNDFKSTLPARLGLDDPPLPFGAHPISLGR